MKPRTIIKILSNDRDIRFGTVVLIAICLLIITCAAIIYIVKNFTL